MVTQNSTVIFPSSARISWFTVEHIIWGNLIVVKKSHLCWIMFMSVVLDLLILVIKGLKVSERIQFEKCSTSQTVTFKRI